MQKIDWRCSPVFSTPIDSLQLIDPNAGLGVLPAFDVLHGAQSLDLNTSRDILDALFKAERVLIEKAGTLEALVEFGHERMPLHPTMTYVIPVVFSMLGRRKEAEAYIEARVDRFRSDGEQELLGFYERFVEELKTGLS